MLILHVFCTVKPEMIEAFKEATVKNASNSIKEPGVIRFDLLQQQDDPAKFVISEVYKSAEAIAAHKETEHYAEWMPVCATNAVGAKKQDDIYQRFS